MLNRKRLQIIKLESELSAAGVVADYYQNNYRELLTELAKETKNYCGNDLRWLEDLVREHVSRLPAGS